MDKNMRILIIHNEYSTYSGEETVVYNMIKLLKDKGHEIEIYKRSSNEINKNIFSQIPSHINIYDFYNSYGERLLGDENLKIYSREEWQADEAEKRKDSFISLKDNDPESSLSLLDY